MGTAPFVLHRMFIRFSQPFVFSAFVLFWQLIISNVVYLSVSVGVFLLFILYCVYLYRLGAKNARQITSVAPVAAEYASDRSPTARNSKLVNKETEEGHVMSDDNIPLNLPMLDQRFEVLDIEDAAHSVEDSDDQHEPIFHHPPQRASRREIPASLSSEDLSDSHLQTKHNNNPTNKGKKPSSSTKHRPCQLNEEEESHRSARRHHPHRHAYISTSSTASQQAKSSNDSDQDEHFSHSDSSSSDGSSVDSVN
jgi:Ca2+/Na+ antiporter